jgi:FtsZ-interacting cell division protein ZipA
MDTWLIVVIVVAVVVVLALAAVALSKRRKVSGLRKQEQAREHLQEAEVRGARADREQALAEEQAHDERSAAEDLRAKAEKLAPGLADGQGGQHRAGEPVRPDESGGGATRR